MALVHPGEDEEESETIRGNGTGGRWLLVAIGLFGAALLYGDGTITPAISVLSAVEVVEVAAPGFAPFVVPATIAILVALFLFQRRGSAGVGIVFGPLMLVWFVVIGVLGIGGIAANPGVLRAVDPAYAASLFAADPAVAFVVLSAVFLVVTGGEALYADIGHFGTRPIRAAWFCLVLPGLLLNYFGQGALLLDRPLAVQNPFYLLAPGWARYPLVVLATVATVIASQAIISGSFSLTRQAIQLGFCPRLYTEHTSAEEIGQIYIPAVNWTLMLVTVGLVIGFERSSNLAAAYGVAVATTMVITTILMFVVARELWRWPLAAALALSALFLVPDLAFFAANMTKVDRGGWFPLVVAAIVYALMSTWYRGRELLARRMRERAAPVEEFLAGLAPEEPRRVEGTAVFLTGEPHGTPTALGLQLKHNHVLHERVLLLTVVTAPVPFVPDERRVRITD
jgi:KUP system potassium uptake protein